MTSPKKAPTGNESTTGNGPVFAIFALFFYLGMGAIWQAKQELIVTIYGFVRMVQGWIFYLLSFVVDNPYADWYVFFRDSEPSAVEFEHLSASSVYFNIFGLIFFVLPFAWYIWRVSVRTNPTNENNFAPPKDYSVETFCRRMEPYHPHLVLWRKFDPFSRSIDTGPHRMPDTSKQFVLRNRCFVMMDNGHIAPNDAAVTALFTEQLGRRWEGLNALTKWEKVIVAICAARIVAADDRLTDGQYQYAVELQEKIQTRMWLLAGQHYNREADTMDFDLPPEVETSLQHYFSHESVQRIVTQHAYVYTVLYGLITDSRGIGIFAHCHVGWLAVVDRALNILVNTVGRGTPFTESAAVHAHYLWEVRMGEALSEPMVSYAVKALHEELAKFKLSRSEREEAIAILAEMRCAGERASEAVRHKVDQDYFLGISTFVTDSGVLCPIGFTVIDENQHRLFDALCLPEETPSPEQMRAIGLTAEALALAKYDARAIIDQVAALVAGNSVFTVCPGEITKHAPAIQLAARDRLYDMFNVHVAATGKPDLSRDEAFQACNLKAGGDSASLATLALQLFHKHPEVRQPVKGVVA